VIPGGLRLVLAPGVLLAIAGLAWALPPRLRAPVRILGVLAVGAAIGLLLGDANVVVSAGSVEGSFGSPLAGVNFLFRADSTGLVLALIASVAALFALLDADRGTTETAALLLCAAGALGASLAGNVVMLFAGLEAANIGTLVLLTDGRRRGRGAAALMAIEHLAALGLLAAAVELSVTAGTTDLSALPGGAITVIVGIPWALAGAARLLAPALQPSGRNLAWAAVAAVPAGAVVLLRLRAAAGGPLPTAVTVLLAGIGAAAAIRGALVAARSYRTPTLAGRGLLLAAAGPPIALIGLSTDAALTAAAAGFCALELSAAAAPLWSRITDATYTRWFAAAALLAAGGLPAGFGTAALCLGLGAVASQGRAAAPLLLSIGVAAVVAAIAAVRCTAGALAAPRETPDGRPSPLALLAVALSGLAALLPGGVATTAVAALAPTNVGYSADLGTVRGPQGGWAGGYVLVAGAWLVLVVVSGLRLVGVRLVADRGDRAAGPDGGLRLVLGPRRAVRRPLRRALAATAAVDRWLVVQPQLPLLLAAALLAILFLH